MKFYRNEQTGEYRIVKDLGNGYFAVVKLVRPGVYTLKLWHGDLERTASYWNTKPFEPDVQMSRYLAKAYKSVVNKMQIKFSRL